MAIRWHDIRHKKLRPPHPAYQAALRDLFYLVDMIDRCDTEGRALPDDLAELIAERKGRRTVAYVAVWRKAPNSDYGVSFPDVPGCITAGKTLDEAHALAIEALRFHLDGMIADAEALPVARSLDETAADPEHQDGTPFCVTVDMRPASATR